MTTYYVCDNGTDCNAGAGSGWSTGNDTNNGTSKATPFKTIQAAVDTVSAGNTVIVGDGTYIDTNSDGWVASIRHISGTSVNWITFQSENYLGAVIDGQDVVSSIGFNIYSSAYILLDGFDIKRPVHGIQLVGTTHDIYAYKTRFRDLGRTFMEPGACEPYYTPTRLHNGINGRDETYNVTIDRCIFNNIGKLHRTPPCKHDYVFEHAVYGRGKGWLIQNNIFYDIHSGWAIKCDGHDGSTSNPTHKIINNTFAHGHDGSPSPYPNGYGFILIIRSHGTYAAHDLVIQNNILYDPPGGGNYAIQDYSGMDSDCFVRNNVTSAAAMDNRMAATYSDNVTGVALGDFHLTDPASNDFTLTSSANHLIDQGITTESPAYDYLGNSRPYGDSYDIGAYEYMGGTPYTRHRGILRQKPKYNTVGGRF